MDSSDISHDVVTWSINVWLADLVMGFFTFVAFLVFLAPPPAILAYLDMDSLSDSISKFRPVTSCDLISYQLSPI